MHMGKMDHHQFEMNGHYFSRWRFLPPNLVQRSFSVKGRKDLMEQVEVRKLQRGPDACENIGAEAGA
uniref:Uncharacterized protein n=1 Tax=Globisporangium ultimum (strain ATCC 200006 / CBS 805.95 / DAOM BR144) TaxID=431595 RepID=K3X8P5_GLOUD